MTHDQLQRVERKPIHERRRIAEIEGRQAMAEVRARDAFVRANMERLRAQRLAKEQQDQETEHAAERVSARK